MRRRRGWALGAVVLLAAACGSSSGGGGSFTATTPVPDACSTLALSDVQTLLPGASAGSALPPDDNADLWTRGCAWQASGMAVTLLVEGALTSKALPVLDFEVEATSNSTTQATAVSGLGDKAVYLVNQGLGQILNARQGNIVVSLSVSGFTPAVPEASMQPLVAEALGNL